MGMMSLGLGLTSLAAMQKRLRGGASLLQGESEGGAFDFLYNDPLFQANVKRVDKTPALDTFLTNASTSPKQVTDILGNVVWSQHNMYTRSEFISNAAWSKSSMGFGTSILDPSGANADLLLPLNASAWHYAFQAPLLIAGGNYFIKFRVKDAGTRYLLLVVNDTSERYVGFDLQLGTITEQNAATAGITSLGGGWFEITMQWATVTASPGYIMISASSNGTYVGKSYTPNGTDGFYATRAQLNRGTVPTAYLPTTSAARIGIPIDYDPITHVSRLLTEPAATNLLLRNKEFDNAYYLKDTGVTVTANAIAAPNGVVEADKLIEGSQAAATHSISSGVITANTGSFSVYVKAGERTRIGLGLVATVNKGKIFDLSNQTMVDFASTFLTPNSASIQDVGGGWYRCTVYSNEAAITRADIYVIDAGNDRTYNGGGALGLYIWGAQLELGSVATSPIPTFATAVTRALDRPQLSLAGNVPPLGLAFSTLFVYRLAAATSDGYLFGISNNNGAALELVGLRAATSQLNIFAANAGQATLAISGNDASRHRVAARVKTNDFAAVIDGGAPATDSAGSVTAPTNVYFGDYLAGAGIAIDKPMYVEKFVLASRDLSNAELQTNTASDTFAALLAAEGQGLFIDFTNVTTPITVKWLPSVFADPSQFLAFAGGSPKLTPRAVDGVLAWSPHNLLVRAEELDTAASWQTGDAPAAINDGVAPDGTTTAERFTWTAAGAPYRYQQITLAAIPYTFSFYYKSADGSSHVFAAREGIAGSPLLQTFTATSVWQRGEVTFTALAANNGIGWDFRTTYGSDATGSIYLWGAQLNKGPIATRYIRTTTAALYGVAEDHHPTTFAKLGMLWEPAGTNLAIRSQEFGSAAYMPQAVTVVPNAAVSPDGLTTADFIKENSANFEHYVPQAIGKAASSLTYTASVFFKVAAGTRNFGIGITDGTTGGYRAVFSPAGVVVAASQTIGSVAGWTFIASGTQAYLDGWYRAYLTVTTNAATEVDIVFYNMSGTVSSYVGDGTSGYYVWNTQLELGPIATSPIPTFATAVTRAQDNPFALLSTLPALGLAYAMYVKGQIALLDATTKNYLALSDGTANEYAAFWGVSGVKSLSVVDGGVAQTAPLASLQTILANVDFQSTARVKANDFAISVNGEAVVKDTAGTLPTPDRLTIGSLFGTTNPMTSPLHIKSIVLANDHDILDAALPTWRYAA